MGARARLLGASALICALSLALPAAAHSLSVVETVNTTGDGSLTDNPNYCEQGEGPGSTICPLRAALESASRVENAAGASDIVVSVPAGEYMLEAAKGPLPIGDAHPSPCAGGTRCRVTLRGAGAGMTAINGQKATGILKVIKEAGPVTVSDVTLRGGKSFEGGGGAAILAAEDELIVSESQLIENESLGGGAIYAPSGPLAVVDSTLRANKVSKGGGAIRSFRNFELLRSTVSGNSSNSVGGGLDLEPGFGEQATIIDSTIAGNRAGGGGGIYATGDLALRYSTVAENDAAVAGGGVDGQEFTLFMTGSILANNGATQCADAEKAIGEGPNIMYGPGPSCEFVGIPPMAIDPLLGALPEGAAGATMPLLSGSPAINAGGATCPTADAGSGPSDERGVVRPQGAGCDLGAFESAANVAVSLAATPEQVSVGGLETLTATVRSTGAEVVTGTAVTVQIASPAAAVLPPAGCSVAPQQTVTCPLGQLSPGETRNLPIAVVPSQPGPGAASARVQVDQGDYEPADDSAQSRFTVAGTATGPGPSSGAHTQPGKLLLLARTLRVDGHGRVTVKLRCAAGAGQSCSDLLALFSAGGRLPAQTARRRAASRALLLASGPAQIPAGATVTIALKLRRSALRAVLAHLPRAARLAITPLGSVRTVYPVRLVRAPAHKRRRR